MKRFAGHHIMKRFAGPSCLFCAFSLAGTSVIAAKFINESLGPFTITATSLLFAVLFLAPACGIKAAGAVCRLTRKEILLLALQAFFGIFLFRLFLLCGLLKTSAAEAGLLTGATPGITALLAAIFLKEKPDAGKTTGVVCTVAGVVLINNLPVAGTTFSAAHLFGNMMVLGAAACESTFNIISRFSATAVVTDRKNDMTPMTRTFLVALAAFFLCLIPCLTEQPLLRLTALHAVQWLALLWYGVFVTALAFLFWYAGIERCRAFTAAAFSGMMPFTALLLSVFLLGENVVPVQWVGGGLVVTGMILLGLRKVTAGTS